jgi:hypothetical protein
LVAVTEFDRLWETDTTEVSRARMDELMVIIQEFETGPSRMEQKGRTGG